LGGCAAESTTDSIVEPSFDSKSDFFTDIAKSEPIAFGTTVTGAFERDFQFFAYTFRAREGAVVTAEVTHRGSASALDTTLFLYRLDADGGTPDRLVVDDNDGWGALSKVADFELYSESDYAVIVGTKDTAGRGHFTLALECLNGACEVEVVEPPCPPAAQARLTECIEEVANDWDFEAELALVIEDACVTSDDIHNFDEVPLEAHDACRAWAAAAYPATEGRTAGVLEAIADAEIDAVIERVNESPACTSGPDHNCEFALRAYRYDPSLTFTTEELLAHARLSLPPGPGLFAVQQTGAAGREAHGRLAQEMGVEADLEAILERPGDAGADAEHGSFGGDNIQWNFGDCGGTTTVVHLVDHAIVVETSLFHCSG
jgi:hypothetical protein